MLFLSFGFCIPPSAACTWNEGKSVGHVFLYPCLRDPRICKNAERCSKLLKYLLLFIKYHCARNWAF
uniref:Uncharacterized protein MANES_12G018600 n=1 Tax=Rhizophora mucronata TaxID=61149 RepID=A0A2P2II27_RHIMU